MSTPNPYAPPSTKSVSRPHSQFVPDGWPIPAVMAIVFAWSGFASWFSFAGRRLGKLQDVFGFGGIGLCLIGAPIIGALIVRRPRRIQKLRLQCLLNVFGLVVYIAGVRMHATGSFNHQTWWLFSATGALMIGLTAIVELLQTRIRKKESPS